MKKHIWCMIGVFVLSGSTLLWAGDMVNSGFELEFGPVEDKNVWGDYGSAFGETYQVNEGQENGPKKAHRGSRALLINIPQNSWNGIWQQLPWEENKSFEWTAYYMIAGGELPSETSTFMKAEFLDGLDQQIGEMVGENHTQDTDGKWIKETVKGVTPPKTRAIRFVLLGGSNPDSETVINQIFWDDSDVDD